MRRVTGNRGTTEESLTLLIVFQNYKQTFCQWKTFSDLGYWKKSRASSMALGVTRFSNFGDREHEILACCMESLCLIFCRPSHKTFPNSVVAHLFNTFKKVFSYSFFLLLLLLLLPSSLLKNRYSRSTGTP